ncbi:MAG: hypothetical protein H6736_00795 [Alphaproteobacteria bacterium]|nr:hypothetical protein [Alphaproteobacteria bacterium]MCB9690328.1 hypothetical protein [Alphaproteobacteria bacterium]
MRSRTSELLLLAALGCRDPEPPPVPYVDLVSQACVLDNAATLALRFRRRS